MSETKVITFKDVALKIPQLIKGMPMRFRGLSLVARQTPDTPCGLIMSIQGAVRAHPENVAIVYEGQQLSYRELMARINQAAAYLRDSGTRQGDVVAIFMENRPELLVFIAALAKLGAVSALVNTSQRGAVLTHSIDLVEPKRIIVGQELLHAVSDQGKVLPDGADARLWVEDRTSKLDAKSPKGWVDMISSLNGQPENDFAGAIVNKASDPFCYFYTSGTTGLPKAAVLTHGRFTKAYAGVGLASIQLKATDKAMVCLPFYHGTALAVGWGSVLAGHATLVMIRQFSARRFWTQVRENQVTAICYVGELCRYLLANPPSDDDTKHSVRIMFGNGLRPNIWLAFKKRFGIDQVMEFYGSSEGNVGFLNLFNFDCTVGFTTVPYAIVNYDLEQDTPVRYKNGFMQKVKKGQSGLLLGEITDSSPFDGYTDPEKTERTILRNVFKAGDAWFNTGDLMRDQGYRHAQFVDRLGDTFRWKGENVSTTEVENVLSGIESVVDGVVYGVEIPNTNGRAGMACVRLQDQASFEPEKFLQTFSVNLPKYAVPLFIRIVEEMETTGTHKYKKNDLKQQAFDVSKMADPVWVLLPGSSGYSPLSKEVYSAILDGHYAF